MTTTYHVLIITGFVFSLIALFFSLVASLISMLSRTTAMEVFSPDGDKEYQEDPLEVENMEMMLEEENPNKRKKRNPPFTPFPAEDLEEEEPFFDESDPNNISHELG